MKRAPNLILSLDFDGTTVDPLGSPPVHGFLVDELRRLRRDGAVWVVNTGRTLDFTLEGLRWCEIPFPPDYIIAEETCLLHCVDGKWTDFGNWNLRRTFACRKMLLDAPGFFQTVQEFIETQTKAKYLERDHAPHEIIASSEAEMDRICDLIDEHRKSHPKTAIHYERNTIYLRFAHQDFNKGSTLAELARILKVSAEQVFAAGDNYNDLPKLRREIAQHLACPANALNAVKRAVTEEGGYVASAAFGKGIAEALRRCFPD